MLFLMFMQSGTDVCMSLRKQNMCMTIQEVC